MTTTALVCTGTIIALGIYDLVAVSIHPGNVKWSISRWLQPLAKYPFIIFVFGYIAGHVWGFLACP